MDKKRIFWGEIRSSISDIALIFIYIGLIFSILGAFISIFSITPIFLLIGYISYLIFSLLPDKEYEDWKWKRDYLGNAYQK